MNQNIRNKRKGNEKMGKRSRREKIRRRKTKWNGKKERSEDWEKDKIYTSIITLKLHFSNTSRV